MKTRAKLAKIAFLAAGVFTHITRGAAAMLPGSGAPLPPAPLPLPPLPPRDSVPDTLLDKSRIRLAESAEPPLAQVWSAGMRQSMEIGGNADDRAMFVLAAAAPTRSPAGTAAAKPAPAQPATAPKTAKPPSAAGPSAAQIAQSERELKKALLPLHLTTIQEHSVRDYVGGLKAEIHYVGAFDGKQILALANPKTHKYVGQIAIQLGPDNSVVVSKVSGATFETAKTVKIPVMTHQTDTAQQVLKGLQSVAELQKAFLRASQADQEVAVPAIKWANTSQVRPTRTSTAVFRPDGSGVERGWGSKPYSPPAPARAQGGKASAAPTPAPTGPVPVEVFVNFYGPPTTDTHGNYSRQVLTTKYESQVTKSEASVKVAGGSSSSSSSASGGSMNVTFAPAVYVDNNTSVYVPIEGIATEPNDDKIDYCYYPGDCPDEGTGGGGGGGVQEPAVAGDGGDENTIEDENTAPVEDENAAPADQNTAPAEDENGAAPADNDNQPDEATQPSAPSDEQQAAPDNSNEGQGEQSTEPTNTDDGSDGSTDELHGVVNQYPDNTGDQDQDQPTNDNEATPPPDQQPVPGDENKQGTYPG